MDKKDAGAMASPSAWIELPHFSWEALLAEDAPTVRFRKGQTLFSQGDAVSRVHVIEEGRVRLVLLSAAGHEKHMAIVGAHGMVGECSAFLDGRHSVTAVASSEVLARHVDSRRLMRHMQSDPACLRQVLWLISVKLRVIAIQNLLLSQATAAQRVAHHLVQLAETYGEAAEAEGGIVIGIAFTHQEMANIAGLSRVMTSNVLIQLHARGLIDKVKAHCVVRDIQGLRQLAAGP
ncbi:cAMP regulatory protein [Variovorax sp. PBL-H6]|uniref:Crp/Fnr family transcriptional regulator n=1 Tax=Variovorax sp. PBL-H6 TaxID=434009 RepID=UPI00131972AD|nr:Crp/Fnr family transcriptional regulator [Variovorax sp. PBL-H6]VTU24721.1 cAMP regulatory protein [Variovorax sp. PBL-H6]